MNFTARLIVHKRLMRHAMHPRRRPGFKKQATAAAKAECLPQDVLASILVRLPGSDLRRLRRVCKEWRDIIADHTFIQAHMMHGPRAPLTHTIVFFPGFAYRSNGRGFLFDEHWRITAELAAGVSDDLVGACNGLLCFLEAGQGSIKVIEPFTGESLTLPLPLPPEASGLRWTDNPFAYCFGYDATARRYKIVHHGYLKYNAQPLRAGEALDDEELHVYTIGGGEGWTRLHVAFSVYGEAYGDPVYVDGAVYWPTRGHRERTRDKELVRFDLSTEKITLEATAMHLPVETPSRSEMAKFFRPADSTPWVMTYGRHGEWDAWFPGAKRARLPKGHVLLHHSFDLVLYLRTVRRSLEFGKGELLFDEEWQEQPRRRGHKDKYNDRTSFVPARRRQHLPIGEECEARTFGYSPTVAAAPLALYLGTPSPYTIGKTL